MVDPLAEVVSLLQPSATLSKVVGGAGRWRLRRTDGGQPFYCVVLAGGCRLAVAGHASVPLHAGDFVLIPAARDYTVSSLVEPAAAKLHAVPQELPGGEIRLGETDGPADVTILVGHCAFGSPDAALLVSLLPAVVHVRGDSRLATLVQLVGEESRVRRPAREVVLARLLEVLMIEALRTTTGTAAPPGLVRGLGDDRVAGALRSMHEQPGRAWTVAALAREASLSRSAFFERFRSAVGTAPMDYLLTWRMALARRLLRRRAGDVAAVARKVGYGSASTFSVAFAGHVGMPPARFAKADPA